MFNHDYKNYPELSNTDLSVMGFSSPHVQITEDFYAEVVKVHDGDTITLKTDFRDFTFPLRFANIDAPELSEGGQTTKQWLESKILGRNVLVIIDMKNRVDKYGRLLGRVISNGMDIGEEEMYLGLAKPYGKIKEGQVPLISKLLKVLPWS